MLFELWTFGVTAIILGGYWMTELLKKDIDV